MPREPFQGPRQIKLYYFLSDSIPINIEQVKAVRQKSKDLEKQIICLLKDTIK